MRINSIDIRGFRKFDNVHINLEENITVVAGANNTGKTSLVELFCKVFYGSGEKFNIDDMPIAKCHNWSNKVYKGLLKLYKSTENSITEEQIINKILDLNGIGLKEKNKKKENNEEKKTLKIPKIEIKFEITYDKEKDDIREFADYLMDFDESKSGFYFVFTYEMNPEKLIKILKENIVKIDTRMKKIKGKEEDCTDEKTSENSSGCIQGLQDLLIAIFELSCEEVVYYADQNYKNKQVMDTASFRKLFNYKHIIASRKLDDESTDKGRRLSRAIVEIASLDEKWNKKTNELLDNLIQIIDDENISNIAKETSTNALNSIIKEISDTNGGEEGEIVLDIDINESEVESFIKRVTKAKYNIENYYLSESSQGLGYSNLIYIVLEINKFKADYDEKKVNFLIIEEPEAHMHPQMQYVFTNHLQETINDDIDKEVHIQYMVTTHSHQVVRCSKITQIRVLRQKKYFECNLYDMRLFMEGLKDDKKKKELFEFYEILYAINFSDLIFADKVILYEGDTERMYIKYILTQDEYKNIGSQYISYVQVGGAYAHKYMPLLEYLDIKAIIITDIDYEKNVDVEEAIKGASSSNSTINMLYKREYKKNPKNIKGLYKWKTDKKEKIVFNNNIYLAFQSDKDYFARTFEDALLSKRLNISIFENKKRDYWEDIQKNDQIKISIPNKGDEFNIRDIVNNIDKNNKKTDFIYSIIIKDKKQEHVSNGHVPNYIKEALDWLMGN